MLIRSVGIFGSFELHFESLHSNLKSIHGLNGSLSTCRIVETDKTCSEMNVKVSQLCRKRRAIIILE